MKTNLKPCPFCGSKAKVEENELFGGLYEASCTNLKCDAFVSDENETSVIAKWNTRHDEMTLAKVLLLIPELAIKIMALAILACGLFSFIDWLWKNS